MKFLILIICLPYQCFANPLPDAKQWGSCLILHKGTLSPPRQQQSPQIQGVIYAFYFVIERFDVLYIYIL